MTESRTPSVRTALRSPALLRTEVLAGLVVALALIPEAISFSIIAGVDPRVGLFAAFTMAVSIAFLGGRPAMISAATGAVALVIAPVVRDHGLDYLVATVLLGGVIQMLLGVAGVARLMRFVPRSVMVGFVNALAILIFLAQLPHLVHVPWLVYPMVAAGIAVIVLLPRLTRVVPAPLVAIVVLTVVTLVAGLALPTVGDEGELPDSLPTLFLPHVPLTLETLRIIGPYAVGMALVGLLESLMTAKLVDDITDTHSHKSREAWGQGVANVITGLFGGMGGCAMIGQTMINVKASGARTRISTFLAGGFLLVLVVGFGDVVAVMPMAALVAVMVMVSVGTFDWHSIRPATLRRMPRSETTVMVSTVRGRGRHPQPGDRRGGGRARRDDALRAPGRAPGRDAARAGRGRRRLGPRGLHGHRRALLRLQQRPLRPVRVRRGPRRRDHRPVGLARLGRLHRRRPRRHHDQVRPQGQAGPDRGPQHRQRLDARPAVGPARRPLRGPTIPISGAASPAWARVASYAGDTGEGSMESDWLSIGWKVLVARGAAALVFGVLAMAWPLETATALALLWGVWAIADGVGSLAQGFWPGAGSGSRWLLVAMGAIALIAGIVAVTSPKVTAVALTWILGIWLIARGIFELAAAVMSSTAVPRGLLALAGLVDLLLGVLFAANPGKSAVGIAFLLGLVAFVWGLVFVLVGLWVRREGAGDLGPAVRPAGPG